MALEQPLALYSYDDYAALDDDRRYEVHDGELMPMTPAPSFRHQLVVGQLFRLIANYVQAQGFGHGVVLAAPFDVILRSERPALVLQPDVLFVSEAHRNRLQDHGLVGAPDLAIEVLSPSTARRDSVHKRNHYARYGVSEYWMVLPDLGQIEVMRLGTEGHYERPVVYELEDLLETPLLPGFQLSLAQVFEDFDDQLAEEE